jgi:hypothetical protein
MSIVETLALSIIVSFVVALTRKIGLKGAYKSIYNTSKYINNHF